jgi:peroxiredoxin
MSETRTNQSTASQEADRDAVLVMAASSGAASRALRAARRASLFSLTDATGRLVALEDLLYDGPVVLHFFRGRWCSFGEQSLDDFATAYQEILALGANAVAIAPSCKHTRPGASRPMRELTDIDMKVSRAYGLAFELPAGLRSSYEALGYAPPSVRKADNWLVPLPATYLLDRDGIVALAFIDVDYRNHFNCESLLRTLKALQAAHVAMRGHVSWTL